METNDKSCEEVELERPAYERGLRLPPIKTENDAADLLLGVVTEPTNPFQRTYRGMVIKAVQQYLGTARGNDRGRRLTAIGVAASQIVADRKLPTEVAFEVTRMARGY